jgi:hypothetical protein
MEKMHDLPHGWYLVSHADDEGCPQVSTFGDGADAIYSIDALHWPTA